jgi:mono/diheme cytochrome c family protein
MSDEKTIKDSSQPAPLHGLLAEYTSPQQILEAATRVREAGFKQWDTFTPFPVHGIEGAMGIKPTILPVLVFCAGLTGSIIGLTLQWWTNAVDYPWIVSGKPFWSLPANIPVIFELTVLLSAATALVGMLMLNNLPHPSHPLDLKQRFARATDDRFFLLIQASDPKFDEQATRKLLDETAPVLVDEVAEDRVTEDRLPKVLVYGLIVLAAAALIPFALIARARETKSPVPRINLVQDMDYQPYVKAQKEFTFFADKRADRPQELGTVAVGELKSEHLETGKLSGAFARTFPEEIPVSAETMARGHQRYDIYCATCHGLSGNGDGMVAKRAEALAQGTWVPPTNLHQQYLHEQPVGQLFNSITHGVRNMPAYGHLVPAEDRWAIILYVRALQRSKAAKLSDVPESERKSLE